MTSVRRRSHAGFTLVELLVAMVITAIVGSIIVAAVVSESRSARFAAGTTVSQSQLVDAMSRIGRDISIASTVVSASSSQVRVRGVQKGYCVDDTITGSGVKLTDKISTLDSTTCPATGGTVTSTSTATLVGALASTSIFTYYDSTNTVLNPTTQAAAIRRVGFTVSAKADGRNGVLTLTSSATLQSASVNSINNSNNSYPAPVLAGSLSGQTGKLSWAKPINATGYILTRDGTVVYTGANGTFDDTGLPWGTTHLYYVYATYPGGVTSDASNGVVLQLPPDAPVLSGALAVNDGDDILNDGTLSWTEPAGADSYQLFHHLINADNSSNTAWSSIYLGSDTADLDLDLSYALRTEYYVIATNNAGQSPRSNLVRLKPVRPEITTAPVLTGVVNAMPQPAAVPTADYSCDLSWTMPDAKKFGVTSYDLYVYFEYDDYNNGAYRKKQTVDVPEGTGTGTFHINGGDGSMCADGYDFWWYVVANNSVGDGPASNTVRLQVGPGPLTVTATETIASYDSYNASTKANTYVFLYANGAKTFTYSATANGGTSNYTTTRQGNDHGSEAAGTGYTIAARGYSPSGKASSFTGSGNYVTSPRMPSDIDVTSQCNGTTARDVFNVHWAGTTADRVRIYYTLQNGTSAYADLARPAASTVTSWGGPGYGFNTTTRYSFAAWRTTNVSGWDQTSRWSQQSDSVGVSYYYNGAGTACATNGSWSNDTIGLSPGRHDMGYGFVVTGTNGGTSSWNWS